MNTEIVRYQSLQDMESIARTFALTGYFDAKGSQPVEIAKALTKILAGQEMGFGPFASINGIYIVQGRPSVSGALIATAIKRSGKYDYRIREKSDTVCRIEFFERSPKGLESLGVETFTVDDAKRAGTQNMQKFPANMLFNRCISNGYKARCPDVFDGGSVYTPEELGATVDASGEIVESTSRIVDLATGEITNGHTADVQFQPEPEAPTWATWKMPADAYAWATSKTFANEQQAKEMMGIIVGDHGGKLTARNMATVFQSFWKTIQDMMDDGEAEPLPAEQPELLPASPVYN